ncbi:type II toxin-antitoxin system RelE/ParE family toxin [Kingella negevensis]|uniref:type II toxin-antitoxin system RelE/ParE family toxin n=1 Tax=Kingella negevensis TaxID=1522312 RepID=UPI00117B9746
MGNTQDIGKSFPDSIKVKFGHDVYLIQHGQKPKNFKTMCNLGSGILGLRQSDETGTYRIVLCYKV